MIILKRRVGVLRYQSSRLLCIVPNAGFLFFYFILVYAGLPSKTRFKPALGLVPSSLALHQKLQFLEFLCKLSLKCVLIFIWVASLDKHGVKKKDLDLLTFWASFWQQTFSVVADLHTDQEDFGPLFCTKRFHLSNILGIMVWIALLRSCHLNRVEVRTLTGLLQSECWSVEAILLLICFYAFDHCPVASPILC